jgi:hypothetical protein
VPSSKLLSLKTSKKVGRKIRAITKGNKKIDSVGNTIKRILAKEARLFLEGRIINTVLVSPSR